MKANKYDAYAKVKRTIESCRTWAHLKATEEMYENFRRLYDDGFLLHELYYLLQSKVDAYLRDNPK